LVFQRHFAGEQPFYDFECRIKHKDGRWVWIHDRGRVATRTAGGDPLMVFGTQVDITYRKLAEQAQRKAIECAEYNVAEPRLLSASYVEDGSIQAKQRIGGQR